MNTFVDSIVGALNTGDATDLGHALHTSSSRQQGASVLLWRLFIQLELHVFMDVAFPSRSGVH